MGNAKHIGRVGALAVALGVGNVRRAATRMTVSIGAAVLVMATVVPVSTASAPTAACTDTDVTCALIMCGTTCPTPDDFWVESIRNQFIEPNYPGQHIEYVGVTAPMEFWPITGLFRVLGLALGPASIWGPGGPGWPDEPLWKLSGLFDLTADESLQAGVADLEDAMAKHPNDHLVIYGNSQGAGIANVVKHRLAEQYPTGTSEGNNAPDIDFVLGGDPNLPNGGLVSRFPGLYIPIVNLTFNGPALTDTQFDTVEINRQYDGFSDFPLYPLNVVSLLNAVLGIVYVHMYGLDVSLPADPTKSPAYQGKHGDTSYYFFENPDLPLFGPLRTLGVPEPLIDVFEPFFRVLVELGYDRSIPAWEPTPARLIPPLNPTSVATDLVNAIGEGINNAAALIGSPPLLSIPASVTLAAPATETAKADISPHVMSIETPTQTEQVISKTASTDLAPSTTKVNETVSADVSQQVTPTAAVSETGQVTSPKKKKVIEAAEANDASAGSTAASAPEPSADASTPKPAKPADQATARTAAAGAGAATGEPSSTASSSAASSSTGSSSGGASGGDGDGS